MLRVGEHEVPTELLRMSRRAVEIVPECVGMSLALLEHGLTLTLASSNGLVAGLDAVQYLDGGPCIDGAADGREIEVGDLLEEQAWRSEEHTSELQSHVNLVCRLLLEKKKTSHVSHARLTDYEASALATSARQSLADV